MNILFKNIKELIQVREKSEIFISGKAMKTLPSIQNAYLLIKKGVIAAYGPMNECPEYEVDEIVDSTGKMILPSWCDSHTHLVYAGNREGEFEDRIKGFSYQEITEMGGGILNSAKVLENTSLEDLYLQSKVRLKEVMRLGTGAIEIKSGYGLTPKSELKMLRVIKRLQNEFPITIQATFLAAHAVPETHKSNKELFLKTMLEETLPIIKAENLASAVDVF